MPPQTKPIITSITQITCGNCLCSDHHWQEKTVKCRKELDSELGDFAKISNKDFFCSHGLWRVGEHILKFSAAYHSVQPLDTIEVDDYTQSQNDLNAMESNLLNEIERVRVTLSDRISTLENTKKRMFPEENITPTQELEIRRKIISLLKRATAVSNIAAIERENYSSEALVMLMRLWDEE